MEAAARWFSVTTAVTRPVRDKKFKIITKGRERKGKKRGRKKKKKL